MTSSNGDIFRVTGHLFGEFPHKGQWHGALMFFLICVWINGWVNNCEAGDLRRYRDHYDVTVMNNEKATLFKSIIQSHKLQITGNPVEDNTKLVEDNTKLVEDKTKLLLPPGEGNTPVTGCFPSQMASNATSVIISWPHHVTDNIFKISQQCMFEYNIRVSNRYAVPTNMIALSTSWK